MNNAAAALAPRPAAAPHGFTAADRCPTCDGRGQTLTPVIEDGDVVLDAEGYEVETPATCEDCEGRGWSRDERTPEQVRADEVATRARRRAEHLADVAEFGPSPRCGRFCPCL